MNKILPVSNNNDIGSGKSPEKINRKKFFKFTGLAAAGLAAASVIPFNFLKSGSDKNKNSSKPVSKIKIRENPNSVKRNTKEANKRNS